MQQEAYRSRPFLTAITEFSLTRKNPPKKNKNKNKKQKKHKGDRLTYLKPPSPLQRGDVEFLKIFPKKGVSKFSH